MRVKLDRGNKEYVLPDGRRMTWDAVEERANQSIQALVKVQRLTPLQASITQAVMHSYYGKREALTYYEYIRQGVLDHLKGD